MRAPRRPARFALLLLACSLSACLDRCGEQGPEALDPSDETDPALAPPAMSAGTLRALGPHVWEATLDVRGDAAGRFPSREVSSELIWADLDRYQWEEIRGGKRQRQRQVGTRSFTLRNDGLWRETWSPAGGSFIHERTLTLWNQALGPFERRVAWRRLADDVIEERPVEVWRLELAPLPTVEGAEPLGPDEAADRLGLATNPRTLTGTVYVDAATGNRLLAELDGSFSIRRIVGGGDPDDLVTVVYRERRQVSIVPPDVDAPLPEEIFVPRAPGAPR